MEMDGTGQGHVFLFLQGPHGPFFHRLGKMLTAAGAAVYEKVTVERDAAIAARLGDVPQAEQRALRSALWTIASAPSA